MNWIVVSCCFPKKKQKQSVFRYLGHHVVQQHMRVELQLVILTGLKWKEEAN